MYAKYVGKKSFKFNSPLVKAPIYMEHNKIIEISRAEFDALTHFNPTGFLEEVKEERYSSKALFPSKEVVQEAVKEVKEKPLVCETCGKAYYLHHRRHYENHIKKCGIEDDEIEMD